MKTDPLTILAAANPVAELPPVAPVESLTCLRQNTPAGTRPRRPLRRLAVGAAATVGALAALTGVVLSTSSSGPGVNVAAAAYAATSAGNGVIEAEFAIRSDLRVAAQPALRHREWLDAATGRRREQTISRGGKVQSELALSPGWAEIWSSGPTAAGTILRFKYRGRDEKPLKPSGLEFYRQLYQGGAIKLVGRQAYDGRPVWKLEGVVGFTQRGRGARLQPILGEVILVDPTTYLPVIEREVDLTRTGHPTMLETRLIHYRRIPQGPRSEALVLLSAVHRGAPTISRRVPVPLHVARAQVERRLRRNPTKAGDADATGSLHSVGPISAYAADPAGGLPWGMRTLRTTTGLTCIQIGRMSAGQLGVVGQDGAFANDGRFHPLAPQAIENPADCGPPHAPGGSRLAASTSGGGILSVSSQGVPASDSPLGCSPPGDRETHPNPPVCPEDDERAIFTGTLGPSARSITYTTPDGRVHTIKLGDDGAYLIVARANARLDQGGANISGPVPPPGDGQPIRRITYDNGSECKLQGTKETDNTGRPCKTS